MGARDAGWITYFAETAQEAYDNTIMALRVAEHPDVLLPAISALDGFITTHSIDRVSILDDETVKGFVGEYVPRNTLLDTVNPVMHGAFSGLGGPYLEFKRQQREAIENARRVVKEVGAEYAALSGRPFDVIETWGMEDAEVAIVVLGSTAGNVRHVARALRRNGQKVGVVKVRVWRPFPYAELASVLRHLAAVAVLDRAESFGAEGGPLFLEVRSALYDLERRVPVVDYIYGLGGADVKLELIERVYRDLSDIAAGAAPAAGLVYLGAREET
jgi:pyruvate ferredoxin oxidoreductase alpha subunit